MRKNHQTVKSQLIRLYLVDKGVKDSNIYVLNSYPNSTYQNVQMVKESLYKENINSVLFLTAPYHSLRSVLTWRKNAPNIEVITHDIRDVSSKNNKLMYINQY